MPKNEDGLDIVGKNQETTSPFDIYDKFKGVLSHVVHHVFRSFSRFWNNLAFNKPFDPQRRSFLIFALSVASAVLSRCGGTTSNESRNQIIISDEKENEHLEVEFDEKFLSKFNEEITDIDIKQLVGKTIQNYLNKFGCNQSKIRIGLVPQGSNSVVTFGPGFVRLNLQKVLEELQRKEQMNTEAKRALLSYLILFGLTPACRTEQFRRVGGIHLFDNNGVQWDIIGFEGLGIIMEPLNKEKSISFYEFNDAVNYALANSLEKKVSVEENLSSVINGMVDRNWITLKEIALFSQRNNVGAFLSRVFNLEEGKSPDPEHYRVFYEGFREVYKGTKKAVDFLNEIQNLRRN